MLRTDNDGQTSFLGFSYNESEAVNMGREVHAGFSGTNVARSMDLRLDSSSRLLLFTRPQGALYPLQFYTPPWAFHCTSPTDGCYARESAGVSAAVIAEAPFDGLDDGAARTVRLEYLQPSPYGNVLLPYYRPVDDIRVLDTGICDVTIPWRTLSTQLNRAVLATLLPAIRQQPCVRHLRDTSEQFAYAGPHFGRSFQTGRPERPVLVDKLLLRLTQVIRIGAWVPDPYNDSGCTGVAITPEVIGSELLELQPSLTVGNSGANVLAFRGGASFSDPAYDYTPRYAVTTNQWSTIAQQLEQQLPGALASTINDQLRSIVEVGRGRAPSVCDTSLSGQELAEQCVREISRTSFAFGNAVRDQKFECVPWSQVGTERTALQSYRTRVCEMRFTYPVERRGFCAVRASPTRVQITPEGLQLILLDQATAGNANFIRDSVIAPLRSSPDVIASCDTDRRWTASSRDARSTLINVGSVTSARDRVACGAGQDCDAFITSNTPAPIPLPTCQQ